MVLAVLKNKANYSALYKNRGLGLLSGRVRDDFSFSGAVRQFLFGIQLTDGDGNFYSVDPQCFNRWNYVSDFHRRYTYRGLGWLSKKVIDDDRISFRGFFGNRFTDGLGLLLYPPEYTDADYESISSQDRQDLQVIATGSAYAGALLAAWTLITPMADSYLDIDTFSSYHPYYNNSIRDVVEVSERLRATADQPSNFVSFDFEALPSVNRRNLTAEYNLELNWTVGTLEINGKQFCHGELISDQIIVSAYHCLDDKNESLVNGDISFSYFVSGVKYSAVLTGDIDSDTSGDFTYIGLESPIVTGGAYPDILPLDQFPWSETHIDGVLQTQIFVVDRNLGLDRYQKCNAFFEPDDDKGVIYSDCKLASGTSGVSIKTYPYGHTIAVHSGDAFRPNQSDNVFGLMYFLNAYKFEKHNSIGDLRLLSDFCEQYSKYCEGQHFFSGKGREDSSLLSPLPRPLNLIRN